MPQNFHIYDLEEDITSWIESMGQRSIARKVSLNRPAESNIKALFDGLDSSRDAPSTTPFCPTSHHWKEVRYSVRSRTLLEITKVAEQLSLPSAVLQSTPPSRMWYRHSESTTEKTRVETTQEEGSSVFNDNCEVTKIKTRTPEGKRAFPSEYSAF
jgi:hypothetical protein